MTLPIIALEATSNTPAVAADWTAGRVSMGGDSYPENSFEFFGPLIAAIEAYLEQGRAPLHLELRIVYMNTSSVKAMMDIFDMMEAASRQGRSLSVAWHYQVRTERVVEMIEEFKEDCSFPFEILAETAEDLAF